jgi:hypothetical protein
MAAHQAEAALPKKKVIEETPLDLLPLVVPEVAAAPKAEERLAPGEVGPPRADAHKAPPPLKPVGDSARYVRLANSLRGKGKIFWAAFIGTVLIINMVIFWTVTRHLDFGMFGSQSGTPNPEIQAVIDNMNALDGWVADLHIESNYRPSEYVGYGVWNGQLVYEAPDRFYYSAASEEQDVEIIIIGAEYYKWEDFVRSWSGSRAAGTTVKFLNPMWNGDIYAKVSAEKDGSEEVGGVECQIYSFDQEVKRGFLSEDFLLRDCRYVGKFYVDPERNLFLAIDLTVKDIDGPSSCSYRYNFHALGEKVKVNTPQQQSWNRLNW